MQVLTERCAYDIIYGKNYPIFETKEGNCLMRQDDLLHRGRDEDCIALDAFSFSLRLRAIRGLCSRVFLIYSCNKYEWLKDRKRLEMKRSFRDSEYDYFTCQVHGEDNRFAYIFEAETAEGIWYYSEEGIAPSYDHALSYFNFFQYCFVHPRDVFSPVPWVKNACVYQIFPERFCNGLGKKKYVNTAWDAEPTPKSFYGGDLKGVMQKMDYIEELGVNCLYLTPVFPSPSNHKYDIVDYWDVDAAFGGKEALRELVRTAHRRGIRVLLDGVFNHCSSQNPLFRDVVKKGRQSPYYDWFFIDGDFPDEKKGNYSMFAAVKYMPRLNTGNSAVIEYFCGVAAYWIREFDIDGWRLDVCDEISDALLRSLRQRVKAEKADAVILGEIWHDAKRWLRGDMLDGVMNYPFTKACLDYIAGNALDAQGFCDRLLRVLWRQNETANQMALNLIGSHDTDRFLRRVGENTALLKMGYAALFMMPGMACVYYGDEVGVTGGYDPGCRRGFPWEKERQDQSVRSFIRALCALKKQPALMEGTFSAFVENSMAVLERSTPGQRVRLYMNRTGETKECALGGAVAPDTCRVMIQDGTGSFAALPCA